jgi:hypothetical protein
MIPTYIFGTLLAILAFYAVCKVTKGRTERDWPDDFPDGWG